MPNDQIIIISRELLPELARELAPLIRNTISMQEDDPYLTPRQLAEKIPALSKYGISQAISAGKFGKKMGTKGKLVAKVSEVKKYYRL